MRVSRKQTLALRKCLDTYVAPLQESWLPGQPIQPHYLRTTLANRGELSTYFLNVHDLIPRYSITRASLEHDPYCQIFYRRTL